MRKADGTYPDYKNFTSNSIYPTDFYPYFLYP